MLLRNGGQAPSPRTPYGRKLECTTLCIRLRCRPMHLKLCWTWETPHNARMQQAAQTRNATTSCGRESSRFKHNTKGAISMQQMWLLPGTFQNGLRTSLEHISASLQYLITSTRCKAKRRSNERRAKRSGEALKTFTMLYTILSEMKAKWERLQLRLSIR